MNFPYDNPAILPVSERESMHEGFLQRHFDVAFAAPDGIKKLRELILTLAMQGKLVPQDLNDPPASELLKAIEAEKQRRVEEGKSKMPKPLAAIKPEEVPYQLPQGWEWVRLGDVVLSIVGGGTPSKNNPAFWGGRIPWASVKDLNVDVYLESTIDSITENGLNNSSTNLIPKGSIIVCTRMGLGKVAINKVDISINQDLKALSISSFVDKMFFFLKYKDYKIIGKGVTVHGIRQDELLNLLFPLPPLPEQHRIVTKIDQLMARCNELEKLRAEREQKRRAVHHAALKRLLDAASSFPRRRESSASDHSPGCADLDPRLCGGDGRGDADKEAFADAWQFITRHFNELYSVKENVTELRKAILQLAVMGKLVPQDPSDPPASTLLKAIEIEKQRLVKEGKIKAAKPLPPIQPKEIPYELSQGWAWVRLGDAILSMDAGWSPKCDERSAFSNEWGVLKTTSVQPLCFWSHENKVLPKKFEPRPDVEVIEGDILITRAGPRNRVGICCVAKSVRSNLMLSDKIIRFRIFGDLIFSDFCALCLNAGYGSHQIEKMKSGMADSQMNISQDKVKQIVIPLPPLLEQHRIVAKVDQLMGLCDTLENQIDAASNQQTALLNALMAQG